MVLGQSVFRTYEPQILRKGIDSLTTGITWEKLGYYAGFLLLVTCIKGVFLFYMRVVMIGVSRYIEYDFRNDLFDHIQKLSQSFFNRNRTGDLMSRLTNDLNAVRNVLGPGLMYPFNTIFTFGFALYYMIEISPMLTFWALIPTPIVVLTVNQFGSLIHQKFMKIQEHFATLNTQIQENLSGIRVVKAYVQEQNEIKEFKKLNQEYVERNMSLAKIDSLFRPLLFFLVGIGFVIVLWFGSKQVILGRITLGEFVAFNTYMALLIWPAIGLGFVINLLQRGSASMKRLSVLMDEVPEIQDVPIPADDGKIIVPQTLKGDIEFRNVGFSYNGEKVLKNINLYIKSGQTVAIVGHTGSGKTSLINLIPRFYDINEGELLIDGTNVRYIPLKILRSQIGFVPQETFLFSDTIRNNIAFAMEDTSDTIVEEAAVTSQIIDNINEFPDKFETRVGERGVTLSGGQKQRTAISRAIIRDPKILILDDSLSSVDTYTEEEILTRLRRVMQNRTSLIISHRVSTVKDADMIVVLEEGEIVEQGAHEELIEMNGIYADLYQKQLLSEELEEF